MKKGNELEFTSSSTAWTEDYAMKVILQGMLPSCDRVIQVGLSDFSVFHQSGDELRRKRYAAAAGLVDSWLGEQSDYDEQVAQKLEKKDGINFRTPK